METRLSIWRENASYIALTLLRIGVGLIFIAHGLQKAVDLPGAANAFANLGIPYPNLAAYGAVAGELVGGLLLLIGFLTPLAALGPLTVMLVAIAKVHWGKGLFLQNGGWEFALTMLLVSLYFVVRGAGPISVDGILGMMWARARERRALRSVPPGAAGTPA